MKENKTRSLLLALGIVVLLVGVLAASALAQNETPAPSTPTAPAQGDLDDDGDMPFHGMFGRGGFGHFGGPDGNDEALANALGITVEELQAARLKAFETQLAAAVEQGALTQEQADQMLAMRKLQAYIDHEAILATALGMTTDELQSALESGKTLQDLLTEQNLTLAQLQEKMQAAKEAALQQAVTDGVITQDQADQILSGEGFGFGFGGHGPGGRGHHGGMGMPGMGMPNGMHGMGGFGHWGNQGQQQNAAPQTSGSNQGA